MEHNNQSVNFLLHVRAFFEIIQVLLKSQTSIQVMLNCAVLSEAGIFDETFNDKIYGSV